MKRFAYDFELQIVRIEEELEKLKTLAAEDTTLNEQVTQLETRVDRLKEKIYENLTPWQKVQISRHPERPRGSDFVNALIRDFDEIGGDRLYRDDPAIISGIGFFEGIRVAVCANDRGKNARENMQKNYGMAHPEGYRKCIRLMELAEKIDVPFISFVDTAGAYPGIEAEERGQAWAIAECIEKMLWLNVPTISVLTGEGGSGGALAISCADRLLVLENAYFSVISPEGCASILWHDEKKAKEAAQMLRLTAQDLVDFGLANEIIEEPLGGAHRDPQAVFKNTKEVLKKHLFSLAKEKLKTRLKKRYDHFRSIGNYFQ